MDGEVNMPSCTRAISRLIPISLPAGCRALLLTVTLSAQAAAQQPAALPPPGPPPPVVLQSLIPPDQLAFLTTYDGQPTKELLKDKRYKALLKLATPRTTYHFGRDMSLSDAMDMVMDGSKAPVSIRDGRYVMVSGTNGPYLRGRGMMWFDLQIGTALGVFYFSPTNGEPTPTLTVFSRQLIDTDLSMGQMPPPFVDDLIQWATMNHIPAVSPRYFIPDNGKKYVLVHDEEYCAAAPGSATPPANICEQLMDQAADADMNAAYFMKETHNAANATAWMLGPDQVAWVGLRDHTCGAALSCRISFTRERTRVLMGHSGGGGRGAGRR